MANRKTKQRGRLTHFKARFAMACSPALQGDITRRDFSRKNTEKQRDFAIKTSGDIGLEIPFIPLTGTYDSISVGPKNFPK